MRTNNHTPCYIFSVNDQFLAANLDANPAYKPLEGSYKGQTERAWLCDADTFHKDTLAPLLARDGQESVLFLDNQRNAFLRFAAAKSDTSPYSEEGQEYLGEFRQADKTVAVKLDAWTRDPATGIYWVARK
jgi:hypothetical protein